LVSTSPRPTPRRRRDGALRRRVFVAFSRCQTARLVARMSEAKSGILNAGPRMSLRSCGLRDPVLSFDLFHFVPPSYSLLVSSRNATPMRRRRSAGGAQVHAWHPSRHAMTGVRTSKLRRSRSTRSAPRRVPGEGTLASRRSTVAISGPGPCSPLFGIPSRMMWRPPSPHRSSLPGGPGLASLPISRRRSR
jgi:hypothetical protein